MLFRSPYEEVSSVNHTFTAILVGCDCIALTRPCLHFVMTESGDFDWSLLQKEKQVQILCLQKECLQIELLTLTFRGWQLQSLRCDAMSTCFIWCLAVYWCSDQNSSPFMYKFLITAGDQIWIRFSAIYKLVLGHKSRISVVIIFCSYKILPRLWPIAYLSIRSYCYCDISIQLQVSLMLLDKCLWTFVSQ